MSCQNQSCGCSKCGCGCHTSGSGSCSCCSGSHNASCGSKQGSDSCSSKFLELADQAWMEVLKEKIKENIKANSKHLDELARLISEGNSERWKKKMDEKCCCGSFEEKIKNFFANSCKTK